MSNKPASDERAQPPRNGTGTQAVPAARKKKLSLDISEIDVVLERKISP